MDLSRTELKTLFLEKINQEKQEETKQTEEPKLKKKDKIKQNINDAELKYYEYEEIENIKIYNGLIPEKKEAMKKSIELFKAICSKNIFAKLEPSVLSVQGGFTNILFNEEEKMPFQSIPNKKFSSILKIGCNFGEIYTFPNIHYPHSLEDMLKSIIELKGTNLMIGCSCQPLLNIENIAELLVKLKDSDEAYLTTRKYFTEEVLESNGIAKSRISKIIKNFNNIVKFKTTDKDSIDEIYCIIENIVSKDDLTTCNSYLDLIVNILTSFTKYAKNCKCWKKCQYKSTFMPSKRGAYNKEKKQSKRKKQGSGLYFSSQVTFDIFNNINQKVSKIKLFRTGTFQIPGVKFPDMHDIIEPLTVLKNYWNEMYPENPAEISYILSNMRNYKCHLLDSELTILLNRLEDVLYFEKDLPPYSLQNSSYLELIEAFQFEPHINEIIFKYIDRAFFSISEINNNPERYPGLLVKFNRPIPSKENKKLTIKILSGGKINFDGGNSELEVYELYYWLQHIFIKYWNEIIYDPKKYPFETVSDDSEEYESIYDD